LVLNPFFFVVNLHSIDIMPLSSILMNGAESFARGEMSKVRRLLMNIECALAHAKNSLLVGGNDANEPFRDRDDHRRSLMIEGIYAKI
jgi:hypothetical protein